MQGVWVSSLVGELEPCVPCSLIKFFFFKELIKKQVGFEGKSPACLCSPCELSSSLGTEMGTGPFLTLLSQAGREHSTQRNGCPPRVCVY